MTGIAARIGTLFGPSDRTRAERAFREVEELFRQHDLDTEDGCTRYAIGVAETVFERTGRTQTEAELQAVTLFICEVMDFEDMFRLPSVAWTAKRAVSEWWALRDEIAAQRRYFDDFAQVTETFTAALCNILDPVFQLAPTETDGSDTEGLQIQTSLISMAPDIGEAVEHQMRVVCHDQVVRDGLFTRHRERLDRNLLNASGGNPANPAGFTKQPKLPSGSGITNPATMVETYLGGTTLSQIFDGDTLFTLPTGSRFEHHHIIAGSGHGKTQTLQYLIARDLEAVANGDRTVIVLDSQGDLIRTVSNLQAFAPGGALDGRLVLIEPTDVEFPVSLNLFDVGTERMDQYSQLDRERLTNSILELYDFVLGSLLSAEMTQKQSVIFRYVTRLMLHIPDATIHTLRELMEPGSAEKFAPHIAKLSGTARHFFETEFTSKEFEQTKKQVLRRLWGILENQTFERMFSHPRSKLDLFSEMNAGKVILINTAKDLLKEQGTEIFGRFFIAMIAQAAQERATLPSSKRLPTFVYVDEAADYFDRNIGIILSQARKYNVGMVLAHQYLGQLDPKLQEAFAANTAIKFAGGVSSKDARSLAPMLGAEPTMIETQPKGCFAASVRGQTKGAISLSFPFGHMEALPKMNHGEANRVRLAMRKRYAVHYTELLGPTDKPDRVTGEAGEDDDVAAPNRSIAPTPTW